MKILIACEESQTVCKAMRANGHKAYSCDIQKPSGGHPEWHILGDALPIINGNCEFITMDGKQHKITGKWDLLIAHPPCTYLTSAGMRHFSPKCNSPEKIKARERERDKAADFFMKFMNADCDKIAVENPVGYMNTHYRKPDQIIQPYMFGDAFEKATCLWLKGLPKLTPTDMVEPPERVNFKSGKSMPKWYADLWHLPSSERAKLRSKTFEGIAEAMSDQWAGKCESGVSK